MKPTLILDCSMAMAWCFADESTGETARVQDRMVAEAAIVPAHWFLEVANVLAMAEKRNRISAADSTQFLQLLASLQIELDDRFPARVFDHVLPLCRSHQLTSYDAAYLDLALRTQLPLASLDDKLHIAAMNLGVQVLGKCHCVREENNVSGRDLHRSSSTVNATTTKTKPASSPNPN